jgi:3-hydroxyacyl-CoA dehydrogenase
MEINIVGSGVMASQIAALLYLDGNAISIWSHRGVDENALNRTIKLVKRSMGIDDSNLGTIKIISDLKDFQNNITIESIIEDVGAKREIYKKVSEIIDKPFFTNSSSISPLEIGEKVNGLHFFNPIFQIKLVEMVLNTDATDEVNLLIERLQNKQFEIVKAKNNRGYIANYIIFNEISVAFKLLEIHGYEMEEVNKVCKIFNKNLFKIIDVIGVDTTYRIINNLKEIESNEDSQFDFVK